MRLKPHKQAGRAAPDAGGSGLLWRRKVSMGRSPSGPRLCGIVLTARCDPPIEGVNDPKSFCFSWTRLWRVDDRDSPWQVPVRWCQRRAGAK
jgi:hypothetical protein